MGARWYDPDLGIFTGRGAPAAPTPGTTLAMSNLSMHTIGMSTSPGTAPLAPVSPPATSYSFAAQDPTNESQPTGTTVTPSTTGSEFKGLAQGAYALWETVSPYATGTLAAAVVIAPAKALYELCKESKTQTPAAAEQAAAGTDVASEGSTVAEDATRLASEGNTVEEALSPVAKAANALKSAVTLGRVITVGSMAAAVYETVEICGQYGSTSTECIGQALATSISFTAQLVCDALTDGAGSAACGVLQNVLYTVIPLVIEGDGQAFLNSVTFSSGFNIQDANVLAAQVIIACVLVPFGSMILEGEVIYANWGAIQNISVIAGDAIASGLLTGGEAFVNGFETGGTVVLSGISTAGAYYASGFYALVAELSSAGLTNLANEIAGTVGSEIDKIGGQVGSALCDAESDISCFASSIGLAPPRDASWLEMKSSPFAFTTFALNRP